MLKRVYLNWLKKRISVRPDPDILIPPEQAEELIKQIVPKEAEITGISFDPSVGEVIIEARKPGLVIGKNGALMKEIVKRTKWKPRILRSPPRPSKTLRIYHGILYSEARERERILRMVGERAFRPPFFHRDRHTISNGYVYG
jgi:predicted metal-dependent RNase